MFPGCNAANIVSKTVHIDYNVSMAAFGCSIDVMSYATVVGVLSCIKPLFKQL